MDWMPKNIRSEASDWWQDVQQNHSLELQQRIHQYLSAAKEAESGCLELGSQGCPARIQWRGRRMRVYQLVAWGSAQAVPVISFPAAAGVVTAAPAGREAGSSNQLSALETQIKITQIFSDEETAQVRAAIHSPDIWDNLGRGLETGERLQMVIEARYGKTREWTDVHEPVHQIGFASNDAEEMRVVAHKSTKQRVTSWADEWEDAHGNMRPALTDAEIQDRIGAVKPLSVIRKWTMPIRSLRHVQGLLASK